MKVGMHLGYQNLHGVPDVQSFMQETKLAVEAEAMFTRLMGEEVEPRRQFIEDNALNVRNLDV